MVVDGFFLGRKVNRLVDEKFPDNTESGWKLGLLRRQPRLAAAADARAAAAGQSRRQGHLSRGAHSGARWYPVGQVAVGGDGDHRIESATSAGALPGHRRRRRRRRTGRPGSPHTVLVGPQQWSTVETVDVATQLRSDAATADAGRRHRRLADRGDGPRAAHGPADRCAADVDDLVDAVGAFGASDLVLVSPEVGLTVVPADRSRAAGSPTNSAR